MIKNQQITLEAAAKLLAPWLEVTLYEGKEGAISHQWYPLSNYKDDNTLPLELPLEAICEQLQNGKRVKTIYQQENHPDGIRIWRLRFDMSWFIHGYEEIKEFLEVSKQLTKTNNSWEELVNQAIEQFLISQKLNFIALTRLEKRELILALYEKGLLNYKEATAWLAQKLNLSRATVYNYLNWAKTVCRIHIHQVDAFSEAPFAGNPAGVVLDADSLSEETMKSLTRELNNAETSFVLKSNQADFKMRYFTPTGQEMIFCGHSTVGALYMLAKEKRYQMHHPGSYVFNVETLAGNLAMGCEISPEGAIEVSFTAPPVEMVSVDFSREHVAEMLGLVNEQLTPSNFFYEKINKDLFVTVKDLSVLKVIDYDIKAVTKFCKQNDITVLCVLTPYAFSSENNFHMRCFAPAVGIPEDLFTGSVIGGLIAHAHKNKLLENVKGEISIEQGHFLSRPGTVRVNYSIHKGNYSVKIYAKANHFFSTEIKLNQEQ